MAHDIARRSWLPVTPEARRLRNLTISRIAAQDTLAGLRAENPANPDWRFLCALRDAGRDAAESWILGGRCIRKSAWLNCAKIFGARPMLRGYRAAAVPTQFARFDPIPLFRRDLPGARQASLRGVRPCRRSRG